MLKGRNQGGERQINTLCDGQKNIHKHRFPPVMVEEQADDTLLLRCLLCMYEDLRPQEFRNLYKKPDDMRNL